MDYTKKSAPEIRMAPENKPINLDKFGKKKQEKTPNLFDMGRDDSIEFMISFLKMKVDPVKLSMDQNYYKKATNIAIANLQVLTKFILEKEGIDVSRFIEGKIELK